MARLSAQAAEMDYAGRMMGVDKAAVRKIPSGGQGLVRQRNYLSRL
jgi:hypothetical protein